MALKKTPIDTDTVAPKTGPGEEPEIKKEKKVPIPPPVILTADTVLDGKYIHEYALLYPPMSQAELDIITEDIKVNGQIDPIITHEGKILDGINRVRACLLAGKLPLYAPWNGEGGTAFDYVRSRNLARRNLSASQRAVISLVSEKKFAEAAAKRKMLKGRDAGEVELIPPTSDGGKLSEVGKARKLAANLHDVNDRYVQDAKTLEENHPDLLEDVRLGYLNIPTAMREVAKREAVHSEDDPTHHVRITFTRPQKSKESKEYVLDGSKMPRAVANELREELEEKLSEERDGKRQPYKDIKVSSLGMRVPIDKPDTNMYDGTESWNPFVGCSFSCDYCKPSFQAQKKRVGEKKCPDCYHYKPHQHPDLLETLNDVPNCAIIFACGSADIACCPPDYMRKIIEAIRNYPNKNQVFYLQTKKPACLQPFLKGLPENVILATTMETNRDEGYERFSTAPLPSVRLQQFLDLSYPRKVMTLEPLMDFDVDKFAKMILKVKPLYVWLGLNSKPERVWLPEPSDKKIVDLYTQLTSKDIEVRLKEVWDIEMPGGAKRYQMT